ncbi:MAG: pseudouridine synthase [Candidatus Riflebacteria bacterium]|nr:pseudouridine synthase [Candidatus Riflebacteria bacterium]
MIIYRDEDIVAINKPAGLLVHPSLIDKYETESAMHIVRDMLGQLVYPVHRLDKPTSGILLFGLSADVAKKLGEAFMSREVEKKYWGLVRGFTEEHEVINYPLKDLWDKMTDKKKSKQQEAKEAITEYKLLEKVEIDVPVRPHPTSRYSLLEITPLTGRSRQIRRHMKHIFHHMIGDHQHGDGFHNRILAEKFGLNRLMLHAKELSFVHPTTGQEMNLKANLHDDFTNLLLKLGFKTVI